MASVYIALTKTCYIDGNGDVVGEQPIILGVFDNYMEAINVALRGWENTIINTSVAETERLIDRNRGHSNKYIVRNGDEWTQYIHPQVDIDPDDPMTVRREIFLGTYFEKRIVITLPFNKVLTVEDPNLDIVCGK
jgi:hypothetical protein